MSQTDLFDERVLAGPTGLVYESGFLSTDEERALVEVLSTLPLEHAQYKAYTAQRRVAHYGSRYDFDTLTLGPAGPLPSLLTPLQQRVASWVGVRPELLGDALIACYDPGVALGWHRDVPDFEEVVGVSLLGAARMRFRRYPPRYPKKAEVWSMQVAARSIYKLSGEARWGWQHSVVPVPTPRWSVTFRTRRTASGPPPRR